MDFVESRTLGFNVQELRKKLHLSQSELASACGVSSNYISMIERGTKKPSPGLVLQISKVLGVDKRQIYGNIGKTPIYKSEGGLLLRSDVTDISFLAWFVYMLSNKKLDDLLIGSGISPAEYVAVMGNGNIDKIADEKSAVLLNFLYKNLATTVDPFLHLRGHNRNTANLLNDIKYARMCGFLQKDIAYLKKAYGIDGRGEIFKVLVDKFVQGEAIITQKDGSDQWHFFHFDSDCVGGMMPEKVNNRKMCKLGRDVIENVAGRCTHYSANDTVFFVVNELNDLAWLTTGIEEHRQLVDEIQQRLVVLYWDKSDLAGDQINEIVISTGKSGT